MTRRSLRLLVTALLFACVGLGAATITPVNSPAAAGAMGGSLTTATDGLVYLSWLEPAGTEAYALKFSRYDATQNRWADAQLIAQGKGWMVNWADFPVLAAQARGRLTAVWSVNAANSSAAAHHGGSYHPEFSTSHDGGVTWSAPRRVTTQSESVEFVALQPMPDGRVLALWLDSRHRATNGDRQSLYANFIGAEGPDVLVDDAVCDCCQITMAVTPAGVVAAYRGRTTDEVRDIRLVEYRAGQWTKPRSLQDDQWHIAGCPVNGPQLFARGRQLVATWFTAAHNQPQVLTKISSDSGATFGPSLRLDLGKPQGRVDNLLLADGTAVITWLETGAADGKIGGIYLRTVSPNGQLAEPQLLAAATDARAGGFPRSTVVDAKRVLLAYTLEAEPTRVSTQMVTLD